MWVHPPAFCASPLAADTHGFCQSILRSHREFMGFSKNGLDRRAALCYNIQAFKKCAIYRGVEQLEARRAHNPEVVGSSPASATKIIPDFAKKSGIFLTSGCKTKLPISRFWVKRSRATPCNSARRLGRLFPQQNIGNAFGGLGLIFFNDMGIETFGSVHACVSQLLGYILNLVHI